MYSDRLMRNMLQSMGMDGSMPGMFGGPAGLMADPMMMMGAQQQPSHPQMMDPFAALMPHGFMNPASMMMMADPFRGLQNMSMMSAAPGAPGGGFSYCSSSVTSYTTDEHGRPQVYQRSQEVKQGPDGLKETKSSVRDSSTGHQELAMGLHIHDKAHIKKKTKNLRTGDEEQEEEFVNLEESEAETFDREWRNKSSSLMPATSHHANYNNTIHPPPVRPRNNRLALTSSAHEDSPSSSSSSFSPKKLLKNVIKKKKSSSGSSASRSKEAKI